MPGGRTNTPPSSLTNFPGRWRPSCSFRVRSGDFVDRELSAAYERSTKARENNERQQHEKDQSLANREFCMRLFSEFDKLEFVLSGFSIDFNL